MAATHFELLGAQNQAHISLYESHVGLKHRFEAQNKVILELKANLKALQERQPVKSQREYSDSNIKFETKSRMNKLAVPPAPLTLKHSDYPDVQFWKKHKWNNYVEHEKKANQTPKWNDFPTDTHGNILSKQRYNKLWEDAKIAWNSLYFHQLNPKSWGKRTDIPTDYIYNTLSVKYPKFQLCEGHWKLHIWC
ncbi:hypothetical protein BYT27DRAFT_7260706 [Phlegmacium glaucopus]|nr:hypothetical protein BYT27DRAFT_7260706 [Phlegmacium glaucopus]